MATTLSQEWLESNGFTRDEFIGYQRVLANGPEETTLSIQFGYWPFNTLLVSLQLGGFTVSTHAETCEDIETLIRLLSGVAFDHPYVQGFDEEDEPS